jgi:endonuclease/exonuclease/phosphatase (EEP) superfamily protein YafD
MQDRSSRTHLLRRLEPSINYWLPPRRFVRLEATTLHRSHPQSAQLGESIRVLNWNIAKNNHDRLWLSDFAAILDAYQPNLIFLQEVRMCTQDKHLSELTELGWCFAPNFIDAYHNIYAGVLTAATASCLARRAVMTQHHEPVTKTPKISLINEYPFQSGQTLLTVNSHLINFVELVKFRAQLLQLEQSIALHRGPVIFSGDFNTWSRSRLRALSAMAQRLGLEQAKFPAADAQNIKRFLLSPPLDHIFYRGLRQNFFHAKVLDQIDSSDHKPMIVEFSV